MKKIHTTCAALALAACGAFAASVSVDATGAAAQNTNSSTTMRSGGQMSSSVSSADRKFMGMAAMGSMAEIEEARLALEKSSSDAIKQYAQKMIDDHTAANEELMQIAASKGVTLPTAPDAKHRAMMQKMRALSGPAFDHEYVRNSGVKDHEKMLKLVRDHSRKGRDAETRAFAAKMVGPVQMHLDMARQMMTGMMSGGSHSGMKM